MAIIAELLGVGLSYGSGADRVQILEHCDLHLQRGEFVAILGPSGAGKSTLLRVLMGLVNPSAGEVRVEIPEGRGRRRMALVFQDAKLLPWRKVSANIAFGLEGLGLSGREIRARVEAALDLVGLNAQIDRWPHQLSGGQRQRVGLARALAVEPELLLMDEPFGALDAITRADLQDELLTLWSRTQKTILFVTHDIDEAIYLADRVIVLAGSPARVQGCFATPQRPHLRSDPRTWRLMSEIRAKLQEDGELVDFEI
ncbi:ABC transporter related [Methylocella silvestris BL2]|uniref:ABC transporter related n=1 Tax=Methylocella silvestris (strain DSM 15510 / CIP 108128 / LMG 27833 / NCIMB 13906 / BL2) TaxID=395965 RepID=B8EKK8_METSB|nr:ABC transporter ATP-binding protein [Methylocella silvestris]ACK51378.1 ABC transporter related [Methylocella silvestris BL2]